ncbi:MAG: hypothetical protein LBR84_08675 [Tannerella sp.]|nr:hypothetical protein [Tannerella sp.]
MSCNDGRNAIGHDYDFNFHESEDPQRRLEIIRELESESKRRNDTDGLLYSYVCLAEVYYYLNDEKQFEVYLDSADMYFEYTDNPIILAKYHYTKGTQAINAPYGRKEGYKQFELAIDYYIKSNRSSMSVGKILNDIAVYTANQPDTTFVKRLISKVDTIMGKDYSPFIDFTLNTIKSDLFKLYFDVGMGECMLDSAIFYENKRLRLYYSNIDELPEELDYDVLQSYLLLAEYYSLKKEPDWAFIAECIDKAKSMGYTNDFYLMSRVKYTEALYCFGQKRFKQAEEMIIDAENLLQAEIDKGDPMYPPESFYSDEATYADLHSRISYSLGNMRDAAEYNKKNNNLKLQMRTIETRELEYLYNSEYEERKIEQLKEANATKIKTTSILITLTILLLGVLLLLWIWFITTRSSLRRRSALIKAEKEETELNLKIKEEQAVKAQLEKYYILSDYRLKEIELEGKDKAMQQLMAAKEELDRQIEEYTGNINEYKKNDRYMPEDAKAAESHDADFIEDIAKLIRRRLPDKQEFINSLKHLNHDYIPALRRAYDGNISDIYVQYCIGFAIGMNVSDISECFSIEQSSVHMVRYRLKKKFGLDNNKYLDVFLRGLANSTNTAL